MAIGSTCVPLMDGREGASEAAGAAAILCVENIPRRATEEIDYTSQIFDREFESIAHGRWLVSSLKRSH